LEVRFNPAAAKRQCRKKEANFGSVIPEAAAVLHGRQNGGVLWPQGQMGKATRHSVMARDHAGALSLMLLASVALAGCSGSGFSFSREPPPVDPNLYPANYEKQVATFLLTTLTDQADFRGALIAEPAMKPVATSQRYVVCLRFRGGNQRKDKVAVYLAGNIIQFVDATPEQCAGAPFRPFRELEMVGPG
jgi:hypothetical protein